MYLKSLVLKGFKSFADRSVLSLEPGITAIVGPNGSGKSNISDAVLWVLGERNAKHLRGQAMEDVIFAGSSARKATGIAEVDLVLDNSDGTLPVDFDEVAITRRMYRSGESEYLINGTVARRMDVLDILHDSGLGTGTHSIIGQGSLDSILQSKPEDRRALIEEAAGVLKHKQRKAKSERKLEQMEQHVARARDVVAEVERQLGPLERKAKRALAYQGLSAELADLNLRLAVDDLRALQRAWDEACTREQELSARLEEGRAAIAAAQARVEELQERIRVESVDAGELARTARAAAQAVDRIDSATLVMRERRRAAQARAAEVEVELAAGEARRAGAEGDLAAAEAQLADVRARRAEADAAAARLEAEAQDVARRRAGLEAEATGLGREGRRLEADLDAARREQAQTQEALASGLAHVKLIEGHGKELGLQLARAQQDAEEQERRAAACAQDLAAAEQREGAARSRVGEALRARDEARGAADAARAAEQAAEGEVKGIEEVERASADAAGEALSWLVEHGEALQAGLSPLSHAIMAPQGEEALVERLLGADVAALLVTDAHRAREVAEALAGEGLSGEVSLVLREDAPRPAGACPARAAGEWGRPLVDGLSWPPEAGRAACALLGDVVVCRSLDDALAAHEACAEPLRFATPEGAVVWPSGKVTLGAPGDGAAEGALARARRLEEARARHAAACEAHAQAAERAHEAEEALRAAQAESLAASQELAQKRGAADAARAEAERAAEKAAAVRREMEDVEAQRAAAEEAIAQARPNVDALAVRVEELSRQLDEAKGKLAQAQDALSPLREEAERAAAALSEAKLAAATLAERETYTARVRDAREHEIERLARADAEARATLAAKRASIVRIEPLLAVFDELAASARRWTREMEDQATAAQDAASGLHAAANEARAAARQAQAAYDAANERAGEARVEKGRLEVQVEAAVNVIVHDCKTPLETAFALPELEDRAGAEGEAFKLRRRIANMGTINPDAAEEYARAEEALRLPGRPAGRPGRRAQGPGEDRARHRRAHEGRLRAHLRGGERELPARYSACCSPEGRRTSRWWTPTTWRTRAWRCRRSRAASASPR